MEEEIGGLGEEGRGWLRERAVSSPAVLMGRREGGSKRRNARWCVCVGGGWGLVLGEAGWGREGSASVFLTWLMEEEDALWELVVIISRHRITVPTPFTPSPPQAA